MIDPKAELAGLKDFQRATAAYAYRRMYLDPDATTRFLVADEVGLGKTLIARALIAQVAAHLQARGDKRIDVVYVCSNNAIAAQNVRKLAPAGVTPASAGRLSLLPGQRDALRVGVNLIPLTPGTSLQHSSTLGTVRERALAHRFLSDTWGPELGEDLGAYRVFAGNIGNAGGRLVEIRQRFTNELGNAGLAPVRGSKGPFQKELAAVDRKHRAQNGESLRTHFTWLIGEYRKGADRRHPDAPTLRNGFVGKIRHAMAATGVALLHPDLVIFDEFQRFADLLHEPDTDVQVLVERLIEGHSTANAEATRTLLLSATPYRMHTTDVERAAGEQEHYRDLLRTVGFLTGDPGDQALATDLRTLRQAMLHLAADGPGPVRAAAAQISARLRKVMVRTERLASTPDRDGMLSTETTSVAAVSAEDVRDYVAAAHLSTATATGAHIRDYELVELWKSTPYVLSFLGQDNYKIKRDLTAALADPAQAASLAAGLAGSGAALHWAATDTYQPIDMGNARLRRLVEDIAKPAAHQLLWLPAAAPYYRPAGAFGSRKAEKLTKRIIFSNWHAIPTAISALTSYEVERQTVGNQPDVRYNSDARRRAPRPLRFAMADGRPASMTTYLLRYPSVALADMADPLTIAGELRAEGVDPTRETVLARAVERLRPAIDAITAAHAGPPDATWYWLAPILLDQQSADLAYTDLELDDPALTDANHDADESDLEAVTKAESAAFFRHHHHARRWVTDDRLDRIGSAPEDLANVLAEAAVGSPAVTALRALRRVLPDIHPEDLLWAAGHIAAGFLAMFNGGEATAIIRADDSVPFWRACLRYAIDGNLQAVLDEYIHVLAEWQRYDAEKIEDLADHVSDATTLRAATYRVDTVDEHGTLSGRSMRGRYAVRFDQARDEQQAEMRIEQISRAFNSPFWPFVLASTSIGQEGLDFHLYCHAVVHWNLPRNPVELEQREGRVHRYKNHAVRKNLADKYPPTGALDGDPWQAMFDAAARQRPPEESEIMPYWIFPGQATIERHLFVQPYTRDAAALPHLIAASATYRLAFGQPRQQELIESLLNDLTDDQRDALQDLRVDLRPPRPAGAHPGC